MKCSRTPRIKRLRNSLKYCGFIWLLNNYPYSILDTTFGRPQIYRQEDIHLAPERLNLLGEKLRPAKPEAIVSHSHLGLWRSRLGRRGLGIPLPSVPVVSSENTGIFLLASRLDPVLLGWRSFQFCGTGCRLCIFLFYRRLVGSRRACQRRICFVGGLVFMLLLGRVRLWPLLLGLWWWGESVGVGAPAPSCITLLSSCMRPFCSYSCFWAFYL